MTIKNKDELLKRGEEMKKLSIVSIVLYCLFILILPLVIGSIIALVYSIKIISDNYYDESLEKDKILWGLLGILVIGPIATLIFANKMIEIAKNTNQDIVAEVEEIKIENKIE
ncbi:MAG: hypothetical protein ACRDBR_01355 [Metamycoplasmataceae bacterium]